MEEANKNMETAMIAAYLGGELSKEETHAFLQWMNASPENMELFLHYKTIWDQAEQIKPAKVNTDAAWDKLNRRIDEYETKKSEKSIRPNQQSLFLKSAWTKIAAILLIPLIALSLYLILREAPQQTLMAGNTQLHDTLSDGSIVTLNKNSSVRFPEKFSGNTREVEMEGEVYFAVASNKEKPFIIHAENTLIKVVGTRFNVKSLANTSEIEVLVESGKVIFMVVDAESTDSTSVSLEAGDKGIYSKLTKKIRKVRTENSNELFWNTKTLVFNRTRLSEVIETLEKNYGIQLKLGSEELNSIRFSSSFVDQPLDSVLSIITTTLDLKLYKEKDVYLIKQNDEE